MRVATTLRQQLLRERTEAASELGDLIDRFTLDVDARCSVARALGELEARAARGGAI